jgi:hypothetical protein
MSGEIGTEEDRSYRRKRRDGIAAKRRKKRKKRGEADRNPAFG